MTVLTLGHQLRAMRKLSVLTLGLLVHRTLPFSLSARSSSSSSSSATAVASAARRWRTTRWQAASSSAATAGKGSQQGALEPWSYDVAKIRNFCIIAHIDHGKSTLADRLIEYTGTVSQRDMQAQLLDTMDIERERGITIKLNAARMEYIADDGEHYLLNLIDTPGHVDFSYEVSRSLAACEGALLVVDASQGIEAQTLANCYMAVDQDLEIIPVLNKIDLPAADPDRVSTEVENTIGIDCTDAIQASAKAGIGIRDILEAIVKQVPPPTANALMEGQGTGDELVPTPQGEKSDYPLRALIYDSFYESYRGVITYFRVMDGTIGKGDRIRFMNSGKEYDVTECGVMLPAQKQVDRLRPGEVGYVCASIKSTKDARVGDTVTQARDPAAGALPGYADAVPMVYCGLFPVDADQYELLRDSLGKLSLNDAALQYEPEVSSAMGFGFRCGFLGLLHMEIMQERLEREYDLDLIVTAPSVVYEFEDIQGEVTIVDNPAKMPDPAKKKEIREPYVRMEIFTPTDYTGSIMELAQSRRGELQDVKYLTPTRTSIIYELPLAEVITDFFDEMKSRTKGYASMEYVRLALFLVCSNPP
jgi:small GTP-binding protein